MDTASRHKQLSKMSAKDFQFAVETAGVVYTPGKRLPMIAAILAIEFPGGPTAPDDSGPAPIDQTTGQLKDVNPADITVDDVRVEPPTTPSTDEAGGELMADAIDAAPEEKPAPSPKGRRAKAKPPTKPEPVKPTAKPEPKKDKPPVKGRRGRRPIAETLTADEKKKEIRELLKQLTESTKPDEKKSLRRALRLRGHSGGMGVVAKKETK